MKCPAYIKRNEDLVYTMVQNGCLEIDSEGRVWRIGQIVHGKVVRIERRRAEFEEDESPYLKIRVQIDGRKIKCMAHRLVYRHFFGPIPYGAEVNHKEGNHKDNRPSMLETLSHSDNISHAYKELGRLCRKGTNNGQAKICDDVVRDVRERLKTANPSQVARDVGLSRSTVQGIKDGSRWGHVKGE